jgi:hypothetical protein
MSYTELSNNYHNKNSKKVSFLQHTHKLLYQKVLIFARLYSEKNGLGIIKYLAIFT